MDPNAFLFIYFGIFLSGYLMVLALTWVTDSFIRANTQNPTWRWLSFVPFLLFCWGGCMTISKSGTDWAYGYNLWTGSEMPGNATIVFEFAGNFDEFGDGTYILGLGLDPACYDTLGIQRQRHGFILNPQPSIAIDTVSTKDWIQGRQILHRYSKFELSKGTTVGFLSDGMSIVIQHEDW